MTTVGKRKPERNVSRGSQPFARKQNIEKACPRVLGQKLSQIQGIRGRPMLHLGVLGLIIIIMNDLTFQESLKTLKASSSSKASLLELPKPQKLPQVALTVPLMLPAFKNHPNTKFVYVAE